MTLIDCSSSDLDKCNCFLKISFIKFLAKSANVWQAIHTVNLKLVFNSFKYRFEVQTYISGSSCSKLTTSLVNETLKFQTLISQICQYFLLKKCEKLLQCKSFSHFFNRKYQCIWLRVVKHLTS